MKKELSLSLIKTACVLWIVVASNKKLHGDYLFRIPDELHEQLTTVPKEILDACSRPQEMKEWTTYYTRAQKQIFDIRNDEAKNFKKAFGAYLKRLIETSVDWKCCIECARENHPSYPWLKDFLKIFETEKGYSSEAIGEFLFEYRDRSLSTSDLDKLSNDRLFP